MARALMIVSLIALMLGVAAAHASAGEGSAWVLDVRLKAHSLLVDPATGDRTTVLDALETPLGIVSPDGKKVAFIGSDPERVKAGHHFELFVADVDPAQPSGKANVRRLTTDQLRPSNPTWMLASDGLAFLSERSADDANEVVWFVDLAADAKPMRLSDEHAERAWQLSIAPNGHIAYVQLNNRKSKQEFCDLITRRPPNQPGRASEGGGQKRILHDQHISSYAFSPDGKTLAWSGLGSMHLVNFESGDSREVPLHGIHPQLLNHTVHDFAWRPDGQVIAIRCGFLGGVARAFNADPNEPWPRMFAEDKVFFVPADWQPTAESLKVGEGAGFPSPTADDPNAEFSPPAGDESKPWWVRELPGHILGMEWIDAEEAKSRSAQHPAPPENQVEQPAPPMPPWPGNPVNKPES